MIFLLMKVKIVKMINSGNISNCGEGFLGGVIPRINPGVMNRQTLRAYSDETNKITTMAAFQSTGTGGCGCLFLLISNSSGVLPQ
jgi:hypothetical protein